MRMIGLVTAEVRPAAQWPLGRTIRDIKSFMFCVVCIVLITLTAFCDAISATSSSSGTGGRPISRRSRQPRFDDSFRTSGYGASGYSAVEYSTRPVFRPTSQNISVGPGDRAVLKCRVDNLGTKTVTWRRNDEVHPLTIGLFPFVADSRIAVDYNQRTSEWSLIIQDVRPADEGIYHCQISTKSSDSDNSYDVKLYVKETLFQSVPSNHVFKWSGVHVTGTEYVERGSAIQLICNASGRPEPPYNVDWYKDGEKINSDAETGVIITKKIESRSLVSMLVMRASRMSDAGVYVCRSSNRDAAMINVIVLNVAATVEKRGTSAERVRSYEVMSAVSRSSGPPDFCSRSITVIILVILVNFVTPLYYRTVPTST